MKKHLLRSLVVFASCVAALCQTAHWKNYQYAADGIAFAAPSNPVFKTQTNQTAVGPVESHNYMIDLGGNSAVVVAVADFGNRKRTESKHDILQGAKNGSLKSANGKLVSEKDITLDGNPGLEYDMESQAFHAHTRVFLVNSRLVQLISLAPTGKPLSASTAQIFNSLKLLKQ